MLAVGQGQQSEQFDPGQRAGEPAANSSVATSTTEGLSFRDDKSMASSSSLSTLLPSPSSCDFRPLFITLTDAGVAKCLVSVKAYTSAVTAMTITDKLVYTGSQDGEIFCWSRAGDDLTLLDSFGTKAKGSVKCIVLEQLSGRSGVIVTQHHKVQLWHQEIITGNDKTKKRCKHRLVTTLPTFLDRVTRIGRRVRVRRHETAAWNSHYDLVTSAATVSLSSAGLVLFSASWDRSIKAWSLRSLACIDSVADAHADAINSLHLVPPRRRSSAVLFSASSDGTVRAWEASHGARLSLVSTLHHSSGVNAIAVAAVVATTDSLVWVYAACRDGSVVAWSLSYSGSGIFDWSQQPRSQMLRGHLRAVLCVAARPGVACSGAADGTVRVWRRELDGRDKATWVHRCTAVLVMDRSPVRSVGLTDDGLVYGGDMKGVLKVWRLSLTPFDQKCNVRS